MRKLPKKIFVVILIIMFLLAFSKSYSALNISNLAVVVAMGIDVSDNNNLKISFQFTKASSASESGSYEQSPIIYTVECSSISSGINLLNSNIGKEVNLSHCKIVAFSEEFATKGISKEIYTLINDTQVRPSTNIIITKCPAKYYLENSKPLFENLVTKYYETFANSSQYTAYTTTATIGDFFNSLLCNSCEPYATLGGITNNNTNNSTTINPEKDSTIKSNSTTITTDSTTAENIGVAVFKGDTLVGELSAIETLCMLIIKNEASGFLVSVPNPNKTDSYVDLYLSILRSPEIDVKIINGTPYIKLHCQLSGRIYSMEEDSEYLSSEVLNQISSSCNSYLESVMNDYLYKTSKALNSDINGFGNIAKRIFLTTDEFNSYNWEETYKNSFFNVTIDSKIRSSSLLTES